MPALRLQRHHLNALIYLSVLVVSKGVSVLLIPLYTKRLPPSDYGRYGLAQTVVGLAPVLISLALAAAYSRFFFDHKDAAVRDRTVGGIASLVIGLALGAGLVAEVALAALPGLTIAELSRTQLRLLVWTCVATALSDLPSIHFRNTERAGRFAAFNLTQTVIYAGTTWLAMSRAGLGLTGLFLGQLAGQGASALFALGYVALVLRPAPTRRLLREAVIYSIPFIPHLIGNTLMWGSDRWVLEWNHLKDDLGLYTLATQLTLPLSLVASAWNEATAPRLLAAWRDGGMRAAGRVVPRVFAGSIGFGALTLGALMAAIPLLRLFINVKYQAAFHLVPWIGIGLIIGNSYTNFVNVLTLRKSTRIVPVLTLGAVGVNFALNLALVPRLGVMGAVVGTGLAYVVRTAVLAVFAARELRRDDRAAAAPGAAA